MIRFDQLKQLHLEITNNCQASCPMCTRNIHGGVENPLLNIESWSLERYKKILTTEVLLQLDTVYFCGNYGDPLLNNDLLDMIKYTVSINPKITLRIHTNGSLRSKRWWEELAEAMPTSHKVVFALDGLEDTHSIYRIGTDYNKIIENARAFIQAGGTAEWVFIRFKHNEHQVDDARKIASELGFVDFVMKDSSRFLLESKFPVYDKNKNVKYHLEASGYSELKFIDKKILENYKSIIKDIAIDCHAKHVKEAYITAQGYLFPCCWLGMIPYQPMDEEMEVRPVRKEILSQYYTLVESLGGIEELNAEKKSVKNIINSHQYQTVWDRYWGEEKLITCGRTCGVRPDLFSTPRNQVISSEKLN